MQPEMDTGIMTREVAGIVHMLLVISHEHQKLANDVSNTPHPRCSQHHQQLTQTTTPLPAGRMPRQPMPACLPLSLHFGVIRGRHWEPRSFLSVQSDMWGCLNQIQSYLLVGSSSGKMLNPTTTSLGLPRSQVLLAPQTFPS